MDTYSFTNILCIGIKLLIKIFLYSYFIAYYLNQDLISFCQSYVESLSCYFRYLKPSKRKSIVNLNKQQKRIRNGRRNLIDQRAYDLNNTNKIRSYKGAYGTKKALFYSLCAKIKSFRISDSLLPHDRKWKCYKGVTIGILLPTNVRRIELL